MEVAPTGSSLPIFGSELARFGFILFIGLLADGLKILGQNGALLSVYMIVSNLE